EEGSVLADRHRRRLLGVAGGSRPHRSSSSLLSGAPGTRDTATRGRLLEGLAAATKEEKTPEVVHATDCSAPKPPDRAPSDDDHPPSPADDAQDGPAEAELVPGHEGDPLAGGEVVDLPVSSQRG